MHSSVTTTLPNGSKVVRHIVPRPGIQAGFSVWRAKNGWNVQPWVASRSGGQAFGDPVAGPFKTKREAEDARKKLMSEA